MGLVPRAKRGYHALMRVLCEANESQSALLRHRVSVHFRVRVVVLCVSLLSRSM